MSYRANHRELLRIEITISLIKTFILKYDEIRKIPSNKTERLFIFKSSLKNPGKQIWIQTTASDDDYASNYP